MSTNTTINASAADTVTLGGDREVNRMGFGAMRLTGQGIWGPPDDHKECKAVLRRAIELGVNFIDTADSYGPEVSEQLIAEALYPYPDDLVIATKGGQLRPGPGRWEPDGRPEHLREALEASLRRLRVDQIDLYQLHRPDPKVPFEESVGALADMQREGTIHHVGLSNVSTEQLSAAQSIVPIVSVQNRYNLAERSSEDVLHACEQGGLAFLPWAPLGQGPSRLQEGDLLEQIARPHDATVGQIALAWLLQHSPAMVVIPGTSKVAHLEENIAAAGIRLTQQELENLDGLGVKRG
jgi:pyridoxine 4-dehydrogenase